MLHQLSQHALSYILLRRFPEALRKLDEVLNITPDDVDTLALKVIAQAEGDLPRASAILVRFIPWLITPLRWKPKSIRRFSSDEQIKSFLVSMRYFPGLIQRWVISMASAFLVRLGAASRRRLCCCAGKLATRSKRPERFPAGTTRKLRSHARPRAG